MTRPGYLVACEPSEALDGAATDETLARLMATTVNRVVERLLRLAQANGECHPVAAVHVEDLGRRIAGLAVEAVLTWPDSRE